MARRPQNSTEPATDQLVGFKLSKLDHARLSLAAALVGKYRSEVIRAALSTSVAELLATGGVGTGPAAVTEPDDSGAPTPEVVS